MSFATSLPLLLVLPFAARAQAPSFAGELDRSAGHKTPQRTHPVEIEALGDPRSPTAGSPASASGRELAAPPGPLSVARDQVCFDVEEDGTLWVRGRTYKASFAPGAATYVPFFGSRAARNHPLALRVESVTIAGEELEFDRAAPAVRDGDAIEYERGAFRERYLLTPDSIEQTFEFDALSRRGEIVVTLALASGLAPASDAQGFRFGNELGHVRYGQAFACDGRGARAPIASRLVGHGIELVAPADLVEHAVGRFVIDPVISTFAVDGTAIDSFAADTAYDSTNNAWLTVFEEVFSASDHDVHAVRHSTYGTNVYDQYVDSSNEDWRAPAVANNAIDDQFLVVAARGAAPARRIYGRTVEATSSLNPSAKFAVSDPAETHDVYAPDVGGDPRFSAGTFYCVVWERAFLPGTDYDIHGRLVRTDATLVGPATIAIDNTISNHRNPSISNMNGISIENERSWTVVWENQVSPANRDIVGSCISDDGAEIEPTFPVASSNLDERNPCSTSLVLGAEPDRPWMVAYQIDGGASGWDVRCRTLDGVDNSVIATFDLSDQFPTADLDQVTPSCDTSGGRFLVAYDEHPQGGLGSSDIKVSSLFTVLGSLGINEGDVSVSPGLHLEARPKIVSRGTWWTVVDPAMVVFDRDAGGPNDVYATGYDVPESGPMSSFCSGDGSGTACPCSNEGAAGHGCANSVDGAGALLASSGVARIGYDTLQIHVSGVPATAPVLLFQGTGQANAGAGFALGDGLRCAGGVLVRLGVKIASGGSVTYPGDGEMTLSEHGLVPESGALRTYQAWYRDPTAFCTGATYNLTNGLSVQWIP